MTGKRFWGAMTTVAIRTAPADTVAVLPLAATEQHGPHLPLSTDTDIAEGILARALLELDGAMPVLALPTLAYGHSPEHAAFPGTLTLGPETMLRVLADLGEGVARAGIRRLVLFTSHGGNPPLLGPAAVALRNRFGLLVVPVHWERFGLPLGLFPDEETRFGIHGGAVETSLMLHLKPETVDRAAIAAFPSQAADVAARSDWFRLHSTGWAAQDLNPAGVVGDTRLADAKKGRAILEHAAKGLAALLREVAAHPVALDPLPPFPSGAGG